MRRVEGMDSSRKKELNWDTKKYFCLIVKEDYEDFSKNPTDIRYVLHLCSSLNHLIDWYYHFGKKELRKNETNSIHCLIEKIDNNFPSPWIKVIRNISNSFKHYELTKREPYTEKTHNIHTIELNIPKKLLQGSTFAFSKDQKDELVVVKGKEGELFIIENILDIVYEFWKLLIQDDVSLEKAAEKAVGKYKKEDSYLFPKYNRGCQ